MSVTCSMAIPAVNESNLANAKEDLERKGKCQLKKGACAKSKIPYHDVYETHTWIRLFQNRLVLLLSHIHQKIINAVMTRACCDKSVLQVVKVRLYRYIRLQGAGQLSRNTEACKQTWPKNAQVTKIGLERRDNKNTAKAVLG
eukprot:1153639-Pelagomonas_calceolata.AAC.2